MRRAEPAPAAGDQRNQHRDRHRIERDVRRSRGRDQIAEPTLEIRVRQPPSFRFAQPVVHRGGRRNPLDASVDEAHLRRHRQLAPLAPAPIRGDPADPVRDEHQTGAILAHLAEDTEDSLEEPVGLVGANPAAQALQLAALQKGGLLLRPGVQPFRVIDLLFDRRQAPSDDQIGPRAIRRDQAHQIPGADLSIEKVVEIFPRHAPLRPIEDGAVDHDDHDAVAGIGGQLQPLARREHRPAIARRVEGDEVGCGDGLKLAVLEELEVVLGQAADDAAVESRIRVDPDIVRAGAEHRRPLGRIGRRLLLWSSAKQEQGGDCSNWMAKHRTPFCRDGPRLNHIVSFVLKPSARGATACRRHFLKASGNTAPPACGTAPGRRRSPRGRPGWRWRRAGGAACTRSA